MTKGEEQTIRNLVERLRKERFGQGTDSDGPENRNQRIYFDTWVIGPLECLLPGPGRDVRLAESMSSK